MDVDALVPYAHNAKVHTDEQVAQIAASIEEFGFNDPVAIWGTEIVEGHGRILAAKRLGMDKVPVIRLDHLTDEQRRAYTHVHNQLTMNTGFDEETPAAELAELDFDWDMLGFELPEEEEELEFAEDDGFEENPEPRCKQGDVWVLGRHRLACGDSTDPAVWEKLMRGGAGRCITYGDRPSV